MRAFPEDTLVLRSRLLRPSETARPTWAEVDLDALAHNAAIVRRTVAPSRLLAVVKADAYGHGSVPVARHLEAEGLADAFGVAQAEEGFELREAGVRAPILVLNGVFGGAYREVLEASLTPVVFDPGQLEAFARAAGSRGFDYHLKLDTGMGRLGLLPERLEGFLRTASRFPAARMTGLLTHFARADEADPRPTLEQLARFQHLLARIRAAGHRPLTVHAANSAAALAFPESRMDMVRVGLALYGYVPGATPPPGPLRPVMRWVSRIVALRRLPAGAPIGYGGRYRTSREASIATVPVGYADGLPRRLEGCGEALVGSRRCPLVGAVSMDLITVDVTDVPSAAPGDEVVLLGRQGSVSLDADTVAEAADTIAYEILTAVGRRVPRIYRDPHRAGEKRTPREP